MAVVGELLFTGMTDWKNVGRGKTSDEERYPNIMEPSRITSMKGVPIVAVCGGAAAAHAIAIAEDGRVFAWGRNENGQLGLGDTVDRGIPTVIKELQDKGAKAIDGACGKHHTVILCEGGVTYAFGSNKHGQLGIGTIARKMNKGEDDVRTTPVQTQVANATAVACGGEFTMWIAGENGALYSAGLPQYGQLGHGSDHEYNMKEGSVKLAYQPQPSPRAIAALSDKKIIRVACGHNHTICVDSVGKVYTWGFGGYGRLGHKVQKDEFAPKQVEVQGGDRNLCPPDCVVAAGSVTSWFTALMGQMYCFGKLKTNGDNTMYPIPFLDLQGWNLRSVACGATTFAACGEREAITWGQGGGNGELGYGASGPKSSANPKLVDSLSGKMVHRVSCGVGHTCFLIDAADAEGLPEFTPNEHEARAKGPGPGAHFKKGAAGKLGAKGGVKKGAGKKK